jgi:hypothetical protein
MMDEPRNRLKGIVGKLDYIDAEIKGLLPRFSTLAKQVFGTNPSDSDRAEYKTVTARLLELHSTTGLLLKEAEEVAALDPKLQAILNRHSRPRRREFRLLRRHLTEKYIAGTAQIDSILPETLNNVLAHVPETWIAKESQKEGYRLSSDFLNTPLSLVGGTRIRSELCSMHRLAQGILVAKDFLESRSNYDFFSGSRFVPEICALGRALPTVLRWGKGDVAERIRELYRGPSEEVESSIYELVVAASCIEVGREIEFLDASGPEKKPDFRVLDLMGIPTVIECKMRRLLTDYQLEEERCVQKLFVSACHECLRKGIFGVFDVDFTVEPNEVDVARFAEALRRQPLAAGKVTYDWGIVRLQELPFKIEFKPMGLYTPVFLSRVFGWNSDLPEFDGIICRVDAVDDFMTESVRRPLALRWRSISETARLHKARTVTSLLNEAFDQIPTGEMAIIYLAVWEGSRADIADDRLQNINKEMEGATHRRGITVPLILVNRLLPRALNMGQPDLIENVLQFLSSYADPIFVDEFPSLVYTMRK